MNEETIDRKQDCFSIGSSAKDCVVKVFFDDIFSEETDKKITKAIKMWYGGRAYKDQLELRGIKNE